MAGRTHGREALRVAWKRATRGSTLAGAHMEEEEEEEEEEE